MSTNVRATGTRAIIGPRGGGNDIAYFARR
jgi:hypothetical protein